jgi:hypothetical protein
MTWAQIFTAGKIRMLKRAGAILLVLSVFLPMSSCMSQRVISGQSGAQQTEEYRQYYYVWTPETADEPSSYWHLFAFLWPALALCLTRFQPRGSAGRKGLLVLEAALLLFTAWVICFEGWSLRRAEAGAYVAASGLALYLIARAVEMIRRYGQGYGRRYGNLPGSETSN